jgi:hypothetical protein
MKVFNETLVEISKILLKNNASWAMVRFDPKGKKAPADIDLLVSSKDYQNFKEACKEFGYTTTSHDEALGGRIKGMQINLVKPGRIKIDLHQNFTWRKYYYFDLDLVWNNLVTRKIESVNILTPQTSVDTFIVLVNLIFEKTYINKEDFNYLLRSKDSLFSNLDFDNQAKKYHWHKTFSLFKLWFSNINSQSAFPVFIPMRIVLYSYWEKLLGDHTLDVTSLLYYFFFWTRFLLNGKLPYE